jgi:hypothetical protein
VATSKKVIQDDANLKKPALRISTIVYGRENRGKRVYYLVDHRGRGTEKAIPEEVVLKRWRKRVFTGFTFHGDRLQPNCWQAIDVLLREVPSQKWVELSEEQIRDLIVERADRLAQLKQSLPAASTIRALIHVCGVAKLEKIIGRHVGVEGGDRFGTPDLFLFACDRMGNYSIARFVEVKRPDEVLMVTQRPEIEFLNQLGLKARVVRLLERDQSTSDNQ